MTGSIHIVPTNHSPFTPRVDSARRNILHNPLVQLFKRPVQIIVNHHFISFPLRPTILHLIPRLLQSPPDRLLTCITSPPQPFLECLHVRRLYETYSRLQLTPLQLLHPFHLNIKHAYPPLAFRRTTVDRLPLSLSDSLDRSVRGAVVIAAEFCVLDEVVLLDEGLELFGFDEIVVYAVLFVGPGRAGRMGDGEPEEIGVGVKEAGYEGGFAGAARTREYDRSPCRSCCRILICVCGCGR